MPPYVAPTRWWPSSPRALGVVTGANKGIGFEIASGLAANAMDVVIAARDVQRGTAAVEALSARPEVRSSGAEVTFVQLDVSSDASVAAFRAELEKKAHQSGGEDEVFVVVVVLSSSSPLSSIVLFFFFPTSTSSPFLYFFPLEKNMEKNEQKQSPFS